MNKTRRSISWLLPMVFIALSLATITSSMAQPFLRSPVLKIESDYANAEPKAPHAGVVAKTTLLTPSIQNSELKIYVKPGASPQDPLELIADVKAPAPYERVCIALVPFEAIGLSKSPLGRRPAWDWTPPCGQANKAGWARLSQEISRMDAPLGEGSRDLRDGVLIAVLKLGDQTMVAQAESAYFRRDMVKPKP